MKEKKKPSLVLGILSIVLDLLSPIVGLILGILIYFGYGYRHSEIEVKEKQCKKVFLKQKVEGEKNEEC